MIIYKWTDATKTKIYQNDDEAFITEMDKEEGILKELTAERDQIQVEIDKQTAKIAEMKKQLKISVGG